MFITSMSLDINKQVTQYALAHPEELQTAVDGMFGGLRIPAIWRIEQINHRTYITFVSAIRPSPQDAHEKYGYAGCFPSWQTSDYDDTLEKITDGSRWQFQLTACVLHDARSDTDEQMRLLAASDTAAQKAWLDSQQASCGFRTVEVDINHAHGLFLRSGDADRELMIQQVTFSGLLTVTSSDLFREALCSGIGDIRKYGMGMLTVERPGSIVHV